MMIRLHTLLCAAVFCITSCGKPPQPTVQVDDPRIKQMELEIEKLRIQVEKSNQDLAQAGAKAQLNDARIKQLEAENDKFRTQPTKTSQELTREIAQQTLSKIAQRHTYGYLNFTESGLQQAVKQGVIKQRSKVSASEPATYEFRENDWSTVRPLLYNGSNMFAETGLSLNNPMPEVFVEVIGIADGLTPSVKGVEYVTAYQIPPIFDFLAPVYLH